MAPITIQGDVAVAGRSQDGDGGRAFPRRDDHGGFVEICAGESLMQPATFVALGLLPAEAAQLAAAVTDAEASAGAGLAARLIGFEGTVVVGRDAPPDHGAGHGTGHGN